MPTKLVFTKCLHCRCLERLSVAAQDGHRLSSLLFQCNSIKSNRKSMSHFQRDQWSFELFNELGLQEFQALIVNYTNGRVLLKREDSHWILPAYVGDEENYESSFVPQFVIEKIRQEVGMPLDMWVLRQLWRMEMVVIKNREHSAVEKAVVLLSCLDCRKENLSDSIIQKGYEWVDIQKIEIYHLYREARHIIREELKWVMRGKAPSNRLKWQRPGWMEVKSTWFKDVLHLQENTELVKPLASERSTPLGTIIEAHTGKGRFFLKCTPPWQNDAAYTEVLSNIAPQYVAPPVAVDIDEELMITRDYGPILMPALFNDSNVIKLTRNFVKLQFLAAERIEEVVSAGMPDCRGDALQQRLDWASSRPMLDDIGEQEKYAKAVQFFKKNLKKLKQRVTDFYGTEVPSTVTHNDLYLSNVYKNRNGDGYMFFDWVEGYVSHPMAGFLDGLSLNEYVKEWERYLDRQDLAKELESGQKIRVIINLLLKMVEAEGVEEPEATAMFETVAMELKAVFRCFSDDI